MLSTKRIELTQGINDWSEVGFYVFTSIQCGWRVAVGRRPHPPARARAGKMALARGSQSLHGSRTVGQQGAQAIRFHATDDSMRPMGRATSGVIGMRFNDGDGLLDMYAVREGADVLVATGGGYAKRTPVATIPRPGPRRPWRADAPIIDARGELVGALMVHPAMRFSPSPPPAG